MHIYTYIYTVYVLESRPVLGLFDQIYQSESRTLRVGAAPTGAPCMQRQRCRLKTFLLSKRNNALLKT